MREGGRTKDVTDHDIAARKQSHIQICLRENVESPNVTTGFERYRLVHNALPEINLCDVDTSCQFLGKTLRMPLLISPMTGGTEDGGRINRILAEAAQEFGIGLSVGSQRIAFSDPTTASSFQVRKYAPDVLLCANLGAVQLNKGLGTDDCKRAVDMIEADVLTLHLNPIHEVAQPNGDTNFAGLLKKIEMMCAALDVPVMVKEVGFGISADCATRLVEAGVSAIDVAGSGGTNWALVESHRVDSDLQRRVAEAFGEWGLKTAECLVTVRAAAPDLPLVASGGMRSGIDAAKSIALGADIVGLARPLLAAADESYETLCAYLACVRQELIMAMFGTGYASIADLKTTAPITRDHALCRPGGLVQ